MVQKMTILVVWFVVFWFCEKAVVPHPGLSINRTTPPSLSKIELTSLLPFCTLTGFYVLPWL